MTKNRYVIAEGPDGTFWISLQPLLLDVQDRLNHAQVENSQQTIFAMASVHAFLQALLNEGMTNKFQRERERDTEMSYKDTLQ